MGQRYYVYFTYFSIRHRWPGGVQRNEGTIYEIWRRFPTGVLCYRS